MKDLQNLRQEIDKIDEQLLTLFIKRMDIAAEVAEYKKTHGLPVLDKSREDALLEKRSQQCKIIETRPLVRSFFEQLMALSRKRQEKLLEEEKK